MANVNNGSTSNNWWTAHGRWTFTLKTTNIKYLPPIRQEVHLDIGVPRSSVWSGWQVYGLKDVDDQLMAHFVVPQLNL